jgi:AraC-like DNA-binding protein
VKYPGHLFAQEIVLQPRGEWEIAGDAWFFLRVIAGDGSWIDDQSSFLLRAGDVLQVAPKRRGILRASCLSVLTGVYFRFQPDLLSGFLTAEERAHAERAGGARGLSRIYPAEHEFAREFAGICLRSSDLGEAVIRSQLLQLAVAVLLQSSSPTRVSERVFLPARKRAEVVMRKLTEVELLECSAEDLAVRCGCSVRHVNKLLRGLLGMSLRAKQREIKLLKARQLLTETDVLVEEVARASGFREQRSFCMEFKSRFGMTPTEWRAQRGEGVVKNGHAEDRPQAPS